MLHSMKYIIFITIITSNLAELTAYPISAILMQGEVKGLLIGDYHNEHEYDKDYFNFFLRQFKKLHHKPMNVILEYYCDDRFYYQSVDQNSNPNDLLSYFCTFAEQVELALGNITFIPACPKGARIVEEPLTLKTLLLGGNRYNNEENCPHNFESIMAWAEAYYEEITKNELPKMPIKIGAYIADLLKIATDNIALQRANWKTAMHDIAQLPEIHGTFTSDDLYILPFSMLFQTIHALETNGQLPLSHMQAMIDILHASFPMFTSYVSDISFALQIGMSIQKKEPFILYAGQRHVHLAMNILKYVDFQVIDQYGKSNLSYSNEIIEIAKLENLFQPFASDTSVITSNTINSNDSTRINLKDLIDADTLPALALDQKAHRNILLNGSFEGEINKWTPLHYAAYFGKYKRLQKLVKQEGCVVDISDIENQTPLIIATRENRVNCMELLIQHGAFIDDLSLHIAASYGHLECIELLIKKGASINKQDKSLNTALHYAAQEEELESVELLCNHGADKNLKNANGQTALEYAQTNEHKKIIKLLKS